MIETDPIWQEFHDLARRMTALSNRRIDMLLDEQLREGSKNKVVKDFAEQLNLPIVEITITEPDPASIMGYLSRFPQPEFQMVFTKGASDE